MKSLISMIAVVAVGAATQLEAQVTTGGGGGGVVTVAPATEPIQGQQPDQVAATAFQAVPVRAQTTQVREQAAQLQSFQPGEPNFVVTSDGLPYRVLGRGVGAGNRALIVRSSKVEPADENNLEEDLEVMSRLLNKAIEDKGGDDGKPTQAMGINVFFGPGHGGFSGLYLDGYGALFTLKVNFPVLGPAEKAAEKKEEKPSEDSAWREAREELFGNPAAGRSKQVVEEFSAEKVERLKKAVMEALQEASNIRGLKSDDAVTVCVLAAAGSPPVQPAKSGPDSRTILTIRIKKSDAEALAHRKISADEFRKRATILAYPGAGSDKGVYAGWDAVNE